MESQLETIRAALMEDADDEARSAGASACRAILATLALAETTQSSAHSPPASAPTLPNAAELAAMLSVIKTVPVDQLLDLAINRLRAALPAGAVVAPSGPTLKFHLLPTPPMRRKP